MRIVYINQYFRTPDMAGGTRSYEMARRFVAAGHDVHVITSDLECESEAPRKWCEYDIEGIRVHVFPICYSNRMTFKRRIPAFLKFAWVASRRIAAVEADIVFASSTPLTPAIPAVYASHRCKIPMVFEVRDLRPEVPIAVGALHDPVSIWAARRLERFAYRHAAQIVALSPGMKAGVAKTRYTKDRIHVIPNCSDNALFGQGDPHSFLSSRPILSQDRS